MGCVAGSVALCYHDHSMHLLRTLHRHDSHPGAAVDSCLAHTSASACTCCRAPWGWPWPPSWHRWLPFWAWRRQFSWHRRPPWAWRRWPSSSSRPPPWAWWPSWRRASAVCGKGAGVHKCCSVLSGWGVHVHAGRPGLAAALCYPCTVLPQHHSPASQLAPLLPAAALPLCPANGCGCAWLRRCRRAHLGGRLLCGNLLHHLLLGGLGGLEWQEVGGNAAGVSMEAAAWCRRVSPPLKRGGASCSQAPARATQHPGVGPLLTSCRLAVAVCRRLPPPLRRCGAKHKPTQRRSPSSARPTA